MTTTTAVHSAETTSYERKNRDAPRVASRYRRRGVPSAPLLLQPRDLELIATLARFRFLTTRHLHQLLFADASLRAAQARLRRLWEHHYVDRLSAPTVNMTHGPMFNTQPVYILGRAGRRVLAQSHDLAAPVSLSPRPEGALAHHLIAADFLVTIMVACRDSTRAERLGIEPEAELWRSVMRYRQHYRSPEYVVPDGAFTVVEEGTRNHQTFYLEVVRADAKGGNRRLLEKMRHYVDLIHRGALREVFGHQRVRAILFVTPSEKRAEHLRQLAQSLRHGRRLFWFGAYEELDQDGRRLLAITPSSILEPRWRDAEGTAHSFISSDGDVSVG